MQPTIYRAGLFDDKVAFVTGGGTGVGQATSLKLAAEGCTVIVNYSRSKKEAAETVNTIEEAGGRALSHQADVGDDQQVKAMVEEATSQFGRLDILVNNAGITRDTLLPRMSDDEWDAVINTNLRGCFLFTRAASRYMMRARYGRIINMSSVSGIIGNPGQTNYSASKAGLIGMTRSLSRELAGRKVTVNAVAPGFIESDMTAALGDMVINEAKKRIPAKRLGTAEDVAAAVLFLAGDAAAYVTGHVLTVDGGMTG